MITTFDMLLGISKKRKKIPPEYPAVYQEFKKGGSVVKTSNDFFQMYFCHLV